MTQRTSIEAYIQAKEAGILNNRRFEVCKVLSNWEVGITAGEIFRIINHKNPNIVHNNAISARMSELERAGMVINTGTRKCSVTNVTCIIWKLSGTIPASRAVFRRKKHPVAGNEESSYCWAWNLGYQAGRKSYEDELNNLQSPNQDIPPINSESLQTSRKLP